MTKYEYIVDYWSLNTNALSMIEKQINQSCREGAKVVGTAVDKDNRFIVTFRKEVK